MRHDQTTRLMTKSPVALARMALEIGRSALSPYSSKFSPRRYTQAQHFACLVLMQFFKTDYRGICALLFDLAELRQALELTLTLADTQVPGNEFRIIQLCVMRISV